MNEFEDFEERGVMNEFPKLDEFAIGFHFESVNHVVSDFEISVYDCIFEIFVVVDEIFSLYYIGFYVVL